jgi:hypothetical protein
MNAHVVFADGMSACIHLRELRNEVSEPAQAKGGLERGTKTVSYAEKTSSTPPFAKPAMGRAPSTLS